MSVVFKNIIRDYKLSTKLNRVFIVAPELDYACSRLADYIGENFRGEAGPLAKEMFESALSGYKRAKKAGNAHIAFMQGLFEPAKQLYARRYIARDGEKIHVWCPMVEAITAFEARYSALQVENFDEPCPDHVTERTAAFQLAARVLHGEAFRMYFEEYDVAHRFDNSEIVTD
jgi:hypothetical protein